MLYRESPPPKNPDFLFVKLLVSCVLLFGLVVSGVRGCQEAGEPAPAPATEPPVRDPVGFLCCQWPVEFVAAEPVEWSI